MAKITYLKRRHRRRSISRLTSLAIKATSGTATSVATATGRFGMIGTAVGTSTATGDDNVIFGTSHGIATANGIINASSMVGTAVGTALVQATLNTDDSNGVCNTQTTAIGRFGTTGTASGNTSVNTAFATTYVDSLASLPDFESRIKSLLPPSWFSDSDESVLNITVAGMSYGLLWIYILYLYVIQQARIQTANGVWLDRIAYDFFGPNLPRLSGESDSAYSARIRAAIVAQKQTRAAIINSLEFLTGWTPSIIELWNPGDVGNYGLTTVANDGIAGIATQGYGQAGMYGSLKFPNQFLVKAFRPAGEGVPNIAGYGNPQSAYGVQGVGEYCDIDQIVARVLDSDIYANVANMVGAGNTAWTAILTHPDIIDAPMAYFGNVDNSAVAAIAQSFF